MSDRPIAFEDPGRFELYCHNSPPNRYPEETHHTVQVCIPFEGARYEVTRQSEIGARQFHRLNARDVLVVPIGQPHIVDWLKNADILSVQMSEDFITHALGVSHLTISDAMTLRDPVISSVANELRTLLKENHAPPQAVLEAFTTIIAYRVGKEVLNGAALRGPQRESALSSVQMTRIRRYISDNLDRQITISTLAGLVGLSMWHFMRRFEATEGMSPHAFVTRLRFLHAQNLLSETEISIVEIALEVGMSHSHFSRTFLAHFGVSPSEFRRQRRT
jgi:AraC family transcriptional regulator